MSSRRRARTPTLSWSFYDGGLNFSGTVPITGATGVYHVPALSYYHSFNLFGRSANITGLLPYGVGPFQGSVLGTHHVSQNEIASDNPCSRHVSEKVRLAQILSGFFRVARHSSAVGEIQLAALRAPGLTEV
jgi:hypothetical protein